jgi:Fe2+ or Zn2+ uptake regulation protein
MIQEIPVELTHKYGYKILDHRLDFFGICPDCQKLEVTG